MTKKYVLTRNDEFVCDDVSLITAEQICEHFNNPHDYFKIYTADDAVFVWSWEYKKFVRTEKEASK